MAWLRLDEHLPGNAKVQALPADLFKFWINLLCVCRKWKGVVANIQEAAWEMRIAPARFQFNLEKLVDSRLVDRPADLDYRIHDWDDWQYENDVSTERVKRFRETHGRKKETVSRNLPEQNRTEQSYRTEQNRLTNSSLTVESSEQSGAVCLLVGEKFQTMKNALKAYMGERAGEPPDSVITLCLESCNGAKIEDIVAFLKDRYQNGQSPQDPGGPQGWGWFPKVFRARFGAKV